MLKMKRRHLNASEQYFQPTKLFNDSHRSRSLTMAEKLLLIDTDCGIDDAQAIMMALAAPGVTVLGITCCFGNASVTDVCHNVLRVLSVCDRSQIPVFQGAATPLVGNLDKPISHFGSDGLGDVLEDRDSELWKNQIQTEHAVNALIRLVSENPGRVSLVALGPLTNLALAVKLNPSLPQKLKNLFIMGGNMEGKGNRSVLPDEFNCTCSEWTQSLLTLSWRSSSAPLTLHHGNLPVDTSSHGPVFCSPHICVNCCWSPGTAVQNSGCSRQVVFGQGFVSYDSYAMAAAIYDDVVTECMECAVRVELQGALCRGMMALDPCDMLKKQHRVFVMKECNLAKFSQLLMGALRLPQ
ncbi:hypothetical protein GJAV_G00208680 [Gymnothorax javanicus]|nr:hypothetical protein GJAV_G00208680 [Gymnothorax javanicus]